MSYFFENGSTPYRPSRTLFWIKMGLKNKNIHLRDFKMLFLNMDFNFADFANFNFAQLEIEKSFGLILVKLQNGRFHLQFSFRVFKRCSIQVWALFFLILCIKEVLGKFGLKLQNDLKNDLKISILVLFSQIMVSHFIHIKKTFGIFW